MEDKVCPNHPDRQAETRCTTCFKPLCRECTIMKGDFDFCSDQCATNHFTVNANIQNGFEKEAAAKRRARIRKMILFLILLLIGFGLAFYWREMMPTEKKSSVNNMLNKVKKKGKKLTNEAKNKLKD